MLLRFAALYGMPRSDYSWAVFEAWKAAQLAAEPCEMSAVEAHGEHCWSCTRLPSECPKNHR